ncbi:MAG: thioredoxin family protein [Aureispira sp.]|nr:thioredoxin family protein [Aureispira sp.]
MLYKHLSAFVAVALLFASNVVVAQGIEFEKGSWAEVKEKAKKENKPIFVDAYTTWCGPCKWMAKNVFTEESVGEFFKANFVSYKMDMEKGEGPEFAKTHKVMAYPTLLFFGVNGDLVHKTVGAKQVDALISESEKALDPEKQIYTLKKKFDKGERDPKFLYDYAFALQEAYEDPTAVVKAYLKTQKQEDLASKRNFDFLYNLVRDFNSDEFKYVVNNKEKFEKAASKEDVDKYISGVLASAANNLLRNENSSAKDIKSLEKEFKSVAPNKAAYYSAYLRCYFYQTDTKKGFKYTKKYMEKYCSNHSEMNSIAWTYYEQEDNPKKLDAALGWVERAISIDKNWYNTDTRAHLLYKLGRYKQALVAAEESAKIGNDGGNDASGTEALIGKIKEAMD